MSVANLVIFLIAVATLALLVAQNLSPSLSLVFLGTQSPAFPLSFWIVAAIAVGVILSLLVWGLFQLSGRGASVYSPPPRSSKPPVQPTAGFAGEPTPSYSSSGYSSPSAGASASYSEPEPSYSTASKTASTSDDWETEVKPIRQSWDEEDWGLDEGEESAYSTPSQTAWKQQEEPFETEPESEPESEASQETSSERPEPEYSRRDRYEVEQKPQRESWSGSVYSYGYRGGGDTGVGKSESVYDADYRIITPPPPTTEIQDGEEEDWELQESENDTEESASGSTDEDSQTRKDW